MNTKKLLVSLLAIVSLMLVATFVSASDEIASGFEVRVDHAEAWNNNLDLTAGETISVEVIFDSLVNASDVTVEVELDGDRSDAEVESKSFVVQEDGKYRKVLTLKVPNELDDELFEDAVLTVKVSGDGYSTEEEYDVRILREEYSADIKSVEVDQTISAGETFPVDVVLKNIGYDNLDDVYVKVSVPALGLQKSAYFGDIVALECDDDKNDFENYGVDVHGDKERRCNEDDEDTVVGRIFLEMPYGVQAGSYALEVMVENDDTDSSVSKQITVVNDVANEVLVSNSRVSVAAGTDAVFDVLIVNPTDQVKVYRVVTESASGISASADNAVVAVPAGSSKNVKIVASAAEPGEYSFNVNVFSGDKLVGTAPLAVKATEGKSKATQPIVVLTVILAIIFVVLLIVLIVLIAKKPEKSEEFGESYY